MIDRINYAKGDTNGFLEKKNYTNKALLSTNNGNLIKI